MLEHGPVLPRRIVRVAAMNRPGGACFERDADRAAPSFDQTEAHEAGGRLPQLRAVRARGQAVEELLEQAAGLLELIETHRDARRDIALAPTAFDRGELGIRCARQVDAQVEGLAARAPRQTRQTELRGEFGGDGAGSRKTVAQPLVL